jgi:hypothetical protein
VRRRFGQVALLLAFLRRFERILHKEKAIGMT